MTDAQKTTLTLYIASFITLVLAFMKLCGWFSFSWFWVFLPFWGLPVLVIIGLIVAALLRLLWHPK